MSRGQVYFTDYMIATLIFVLFIVMYYTYAPNLIPDDQINYKDLMIEAKSMSSSLLSEGIPKDWDKDNVERIGLMDNEKKLNLAKLEEFYNMPYEDSRSKFNINYNFYFFLRDAEGDVTWIDNKEAVGSYNDTLSSKMAKVIRIVPFNDSLTEMVLYIWY